MVKRLKRILISVLKKEVLNMVNVKTVTVVILTNEKRPELPKDAKFGKKVELPVEVAANLVSQGYVQYE